MSSVTCAQAKRIAIVVGETSGDILGAGLIEELQKLYPDCIFEGVGGPRMLALGFVSHYSLDRLAVMGLVEPLKRLPELLAMRADLKQRYIDNPPDVFIGIDAPDFNLTLELKLRERGVKTVHYVSPSVWAWRQGRVRKIAKAVDLMLTLFPFEAKFYEQHNVDVKCVGHHLADHIPLDDQKQQAREKLGLSPETQYVALLPGSRKSEVEKLSDVFLEAAKLLQQNFPDIQFIIPAANKNRLAELKNILSNTHSRGITLFDGQSHDVMAAADIVIMASGTTTLEAMLLKRPMIITYKMAALSYFILSRLVKSKYIGLPNLLADKPLVAELIQDDATPHNIYTEACELLSNKERIHYLQSEYKKYHELLRKNASYEAALAISHIISNNNSA